MFNFSGFKLEMANFKTQLRYHFSNSIKQALKQNGATSKDEKKKRHFFSLSIALQLYKVLHLHKNLKGMSIPRRLIFRLLSQSIHVLSFFLVSNWWSWLLGWGGVLVEWKEKMFWSRNLIIFLSITTPLYAKAVWGETKL